MFKEVSHVWWNSRLAYSLSSSSFSSFLLLPPSLPSPLSPLHLLPFPLPLPSPLLLPFPPSPSGLGGNLPAPIYSSSAFFCIICISDVGVPSALILCPVPRAPLCLILLSSMLFLRPPAALSGPLCTLCGSPLL